MPAVSKRQRNLMAAAEHGATFPAAKKVRTGMTYEQMHDFAATPAKGLPVKVKPVNGAHPHKNLGSYLHKKKR